MSAVVKIDDAVLNNYRERLDDLIDNTSMSGKNNQFEKVMAEIQKVMAYMQLELAQLYHKCGDIADRLKRTKNQELADEQQSWKKWAPLVAMGAVTVITSVVGGAAAMQGAKTVKGLMDLAQGVNKGVGQGYKAYDQWSDGTKTKLQSEIEAFRKQGDEMSGYESQSHNRQSDMLRKAEEIASLSHRSFSQAAGS